MQIVLFTAVAIAIYLASDWIVHMLEIWKGGTLKYRQVVFFFVFLILAMTTFRILQTYLASQ